MNEVNPLLWLIDACISRGYNLVVTGHEGEHILGVRSGGLHYTGTSTMLFWHNDGENSFYNYDDGYTEFDTAEDVLEEIERMILP